MALNVKAELYCKFVVLEDCLQFKISSKPVVLNPRPVTNPNAAHHAEHKKKIITFSFTINFVFLH